MRKMEMATSVEKCRQKAFQLLQWEQRRSYFSLWHDGASKRPQRSGQWNQCLAKGGDWGCAKAAHHYVCSKRYCSLHCLLLSKNLGKLRKRSPSTLNNTEESSACGFLAEVLREMKCHLAAAVEKACLYMLHESCALFSNAGYVHSTILWCERIL